jgi:hypothetical protein
MFLITQGAFILGKPIYRYSDYTFDQNKFEIALQKLGLDSISKQKIEHKVEKLIPILSFHSFPNEIEKVLGEDLKSRINPYEFIVGSGEFKFVAFEQIETGYYVLLSFSCLTFMIVGLYLNQITKLKVGNLELEKSTIDQISTTSSFGITR